MYVGDLAFFGLHYVLYQLVESSLAEAVQGHGTALSVRLHADGSVEIRDEGRGIAAGPVSPSGKLILEIVLTRVLVPGRRDFGRDSLTYAITNALAEWLHVESRHQGQIYRQEFRRGEPVAPPVLTGNCSGSGVTVRYKPDLAIFPEPRLSFVAVRERLRQYAFLHSSVLVGVSDKATGEAEQFDNRDGIRSFVQWLNRSREVCHEEVLVAGGEQAGVRYELGLQWCRDDGEVARSFVNVYETKLGSTHVAGLRSSVARSVNAYPRSEGRRPMAGDEVRKGLTAVLSVRMLKPEFYGATKAKLVSKEAGSAVQAGVSQLLKETFASRPDVAEAILRRAE